MKIKLNIKREVQLQPDVLKEKINQYLKKNFYRVIDSGPGFIIFIDDAYSDRKRSRSDYHTRIGEGKFEFHPINGTTILKLIYLTPFWRENDGYGLCAIASRDQELSHCPANSFGHWAAFSPKKMKNLV